jgi:spore germination protein GerM
MMPDFACARCRAELPEYAAGTLPEAARQRVERHLQTCSRCRAELEAWSVLGAAVRNTTTPPPELPFSQSWDSLHAALALSSASQTAPMSRKGYTAMNHHLSTTTIPSAPPPPYGPDERQPFSPRDRPGSGRVRAFAAVAAVFAFIVVSAAIFTALARQRSPATHGPGTPTPVPASTRTAQAGTAVQVYFSRHPESDNNPAAVYALTRTASAGADLPVFAVNELLKGPTSSEEAEGYYSAFPGAITEGASTCGGANQVFQLVVDHRGPKPEPGTVTLRFCRQVLIAGDLDGSRMTTAIQQTLLQFSQFKDVVILNSAGNCFDDLRGGNLCLQGTPTTYPVQVYFSKHPQSDNDPTLVFAVTRSSPTIGVATYAIEQLIAGPTQVEQGQGYYTPLSPSLQGASSCGGSDFTITLDHRGPRSEAGTATLQFCRATSLAGDLTGARITAEITSTLEQFSSIHKVVILSQGGTCFNDLRGQNLCLQ